MKRLSKMSGFSLMEMMIVMLIVAIIAAASAPMINKKMVQTAGNNSSPWVWTDGNSIAYNLKNSDTMTASIGMVKSPKKAKMYIDGGNVPQIAFGQAGQNIMDLTVKDKSIGITNKSTLPANSVVLGYNTTSSSNSAVVIGAEAKVGRESVAIGCNSSAPGSYAVSIGYNASSIPYDTIAIGNSANASGSLAISIGSGAKALGGDALTLGSYANSHDNGATSVGSGANASGNGTTSVGASSAANQIYASAFGYDATASGNYSTSVGASSAANQIYASAFGYDSTAIGNYSTALGSGANASGTFATALGYSAKASNYATALGYGAMASNYATALGYHTTAEAIDSVAIGYHATAQNQNSIAIGNGATTTAPNQIVLGTDKDTVYIPGRIVVGRTAHIGDRLEDVQCLYLGMKRDDTSYTLMRKIRMRGDPNYNLYTDTVTSEASKPIYGKSSDRRLKNVGKAFTAGLNEIRKLEVFNYTFKKDPEKTPRVGVMAQDLQKIFPNAVFKGDDGFLRIRMEDMFYALINAVKELDTQAKLRDKKIKDLESRIEQLEKQLNK